MPASSTGIPSSSHGGVHGETNWSSQGMPRHLRFAVPSRMTLTKTQWTAVAETLPPTHDSADNIGTFDNNDLNSNTFID
eukprot:1173190-Heterocapsa_arctica.AAC.1